MLKGLLVIEKSFFLQKNKDKLINEQEEEINFLHKQIKELVKKLERRDARISELELKVKQYKKRFKC